MGAAEQMLRQKGVHKSIKTVASEIGERLFIDTRGPYPESVEGNRYYMCIPLATVYLNLMKSFLPWPTSSSFTMPNFVSASSQGFF